MTEDLTLRAMLLSMLFLGFATSRRMRRRADEAGGEVPRSADTPGVAAALRRFGTLYYGTILLWLVYPPLVAWAGVHLSGGLRWLGIGLVAGGWRWVWRRCGTRVAAYPPPPLRGRKHGSPSRDPTGGCVTLSIRPCGFRCLALASPPSRPSIVSDTSWSWTPAPRWREIWWNGGGKNRTVPSSRVDL